MTGIEVRNAIKSLAASRGLYGRLLRVIDSRDNAEEIYTDLGKDCNDILDLVMKIEG